MKIIVVGNITNHHVNHAKTNHLKYVAHLVFDFNLAKYYGTIISSFETRPEYMQALQNHLNLLNSITEIRDQILKEIQIKLVNSRRNRKCRRITICCD